VEQIPAALSLLGDSGFQGVQHEAPERSVALPYTGSRAHPLTPEQKRHHALLSHIRIVVENTLAEMTHVRILADVFRHPLALDESIFVSIAGIVTRRADRRWATQCVADQGRTVLPVAA
jgi:hypothetical protein